MEMETEMEIESAPRPSVIDEPARLPYEHHSFAIPQIVA